MFQPDSVSIAKRLLEEFKDFGQRNETTGQIRIARIILLWLNNHFVDWEKNREMEKLLDEFEDAMENANMHNQLSLLNITCSAKANLRTVILFQFLTAMVGNIRIHIRYTFINYLLRVQTDHTQKSLTLKTHWVCKNIRRWISDSRHTLLTIKIFLSMLHNHIAKL